MSTLPTPRRRRTPIRLATAGLTLLLSTTVLAGCDFDGAYDLPLPGSPVDEDEAFTVTAEFRDVLNVVPRSPVMVDDVVVGEVTEVERDGWQAMVTMRVREDVVLADSATAEIRQTSLLGEKYVALLDPPGGQAGDRLGEGDTIGLSDTGRNPEVEEVLGALSYLLSGGGVGQIRTISTELNKVMSGRTDRIQSLLRNLDDLVGTLDDQKQDIIGAMESVNRLAKTLVAEKDTIQSALDATGPALAVLNRQHDSLTAMLDQLDQLGRVGTRVIGATKEDLLAVLGHLRPILRKLNEAGESLPRGLSLLISFPFPQEAAETVQGDYADATFALDFDLAQLFPDGEVPLTRDLRRQLRRVLEELGLELPELPGVPGLPDGPGVPGLPGLPGGRDGGGRGNGGQGNGPALPGLPQLRGAVGTQGGLIGEGLG